MILFLSVFYNATNFASKERGEISRRSSLIVKLGILHPSMKLGSISLNEVRDYNALNYTFAIGVVLNEQGWFKRSRVKILSSAMFMDALYCNSSGIFATRITKRCEFCLLMTFQTLNRCMLPRNHT